MRYLIITITCLLLFAAPGLLTAQVSAPVQTRDQNDDQPKKEMLQEKETDSNEQLRNNRTARLKVTETVYKRQTQGWYADQTDAWREELGFSKTDAEAWFNYYKASKYSGADQNTLDQIVNGMNANVPNTFQTHYVNYIHSNRNPDKGTELMKAYLLDPNRKELFKELAVYFAWNGDQDNFTNTLKKWSASGDIPQNLMDYGYNLLNTVAQNGVLITDGEYDTYPLWIWQTVKNHRKDVLVVNIDLLKNEEYKNRFCQANGLVCSGAAFNKTEFLQNMLRNNGGKAFYISYTVNPSLLENLYPNLYNEGIAYRYSTDASYNYQQRLVNNWELVYKTDYLQQTASGNDQFPGYRMQQLNLNYVSSGLELYDVYSQRGDKDKAGKLYTLLLKLAKAAGKESVVKSYFSK